MGGFDAGALLFKIQSVGAAVFKRDMQESQKGLDGVEQSARKAAASANDLGTAQDKTGAKAKAAKQGLEQQGKATSDLDAKTRKAKQSQEEQAAAAVKQADAAKKLAAVLLTVGVASAAMVGIAVAKNTEFDEAMSNVRAATMANIKDKKALGEAALKAGADTAYSAKEAAQAEEELAKAGMSVSQIIGGSLNGSLALAAAGQLQVARSAEIMATSLTQFRLPAEQAGHVADVLAAGAGKAQGSVDDMALALSYVGPLANSVGWSLEETAGSIAYFASQGILGEKAGTSIRGVLAAMQAPSVQAKKVMDQYGISVYDASGKMLDAASFAEQFKTSLGGLTDQERQAALGRMFGNESLLGATLLYEGGAKAVSQWTDEVNDSGYAAEQAAIRQDNLAGDIEKLGGAFDTALIRTGSGANEVLRDMVQIVTGLVDWYGELPAEVQSTALVLGVATAAVTLFAGATVLLRVKFVELKAQMDLANVSMKSTALTAGAVGLALTGVLAVVGMLASAQAEARATAETYADALKQGGTAARKAAVDALTAEQSFLWISRGSAADSAEKFGISVDILADAVSGSKDALAEMADVLAAGRGDTAAAQRLADKYGMSLGEVSSASSMVAESVDKQTAALQTGTKIQEQRNSATEEGVEVSKTAAEAYLAEANAAGDLEKQLRDLIDAMMESNGENQDAISANAKWRKSLGDIKDEVDSQKKAYKEANGSMKGFKLSLDQTTEAGSANAAMLAGVAADAQKAAEKQHTLDLATMSGKDAAEKYLATLAEQRTEFEKNAREAGFSKEAVKELADQVFELPTKRAIEILANTRDASSQIDTFIRNYNGRTIKLGVTAGTVTGNPSLGFTQANGGHVTFHANGNENHEPQYAKPGDWRVWAEPETGGEWYLPDSPSKRSRSLSLAKNMLDGWGYQVTPKGAQFFASGGSISTASGKQNIRDAEREEAAARRTYEAAKRRRDATEKGSDARRAAEKKFTAAKQELQDAKRELSAAKRDASNLRRSFREDLTDWRTGQRRGENREAGMNGRGLSLVDQLLDIASDTGGKRGKKLRDQALKSEKAYLSLEKQADKAATSLQKAKDKLSDLKDAAASMAAAVSSAVRRAFDVSAWKAESGTKTVTSSRMVDGVKVTTATQQNVDKPLTAKQIAKDAKTKAAAIKRFATKLEKLARKGLTGALLDEVARLGVEEGEPVADALLAATMAEISSINASYKTAGKYADKAGGTVADANFAKLITNAEKQLVNADKNAADIQKKLKTETDRIIKAITDALKSGSTKSTDPKLAGGVRAATGGSVHGPGTSTSDSILAWLSDNEHVVTADEVDGAGGHAVVAEQRARWRKGLPGFGTGGAARVANFPISTTADAARQSTVNITVNSHNPIVKDLNRDAREAAQLLAGLTMNGAP